MHQGELAGEVKGIGLNAGQPTTQQTLCGLYLCLLLYRRGAPRHLTLVVHQGTGHDDGQ
ncbi:hypothetical protein [Halopseudomonas aestusnigri]|uniref:hypothetical protein n=1 Tax=Halopseudomonas aestusnigri TaxID=857252 RepID=UPI0030017F32